VPTISTALDTKESWHYEINSRLSDPSAEESVHVDQYGQLFLTSTTPPCKDHIRNSLRLYVNAWSLENSCNGLVFLSQPLTFVNSSSCRGGEDADYVKNVGGEAADYIKNGGGDYYGLVCERNRTEWCQRGYKRDVYWPAAIPLTCDIRRTGVDKSRCYNSGQWFYAVVLSFYGFLIL